MKQGNITFYGKSGEQYSFQIWSLDSEFKPFAAVYFITKRTVDKTTLMRARHNAVFIGHTDDLAKTLTTDVPMAEFRKFGANCVCIYTDSSKRRRAAVQQDLLERYSRFCNA